MSGEDISDHRNDTGIIRDESGAQRLIGFVIDIRAGDGSARCWLDVEGRHLNRNHHLHGGIAMTLLDNAAGVAVGLTAVPGGRNPSLTMALNTHFLAPGLPGRVTATARITGGGRRIKFIEAELRHEDGTLIATATGVLQPMRPRTGETA